jgi:peptidyl-tRNA hydrolase, PTH2 family
MKQVILVRQDLKMDKGKLAAQCAHAAVEATLQSPKNLVQAWREEGMKKVVLKVKDIRELMKYKKLAMQSGVTAAVITDAGKTFFKRPTVTCLGIGPEKEEKIDAITGDLKMV